MLYPYIDIHTHYPRQGVPTLNCVGIHPYDVEVRNIEDVELSISNSTQAIGEIGLDGRFVESLELQEDLFCKQLEIAQKHCLPVVIHSVKSFERVMVILAKYTLSSVIFHGFIGSEQQALQAISRGYYLSFGHRTERSPKGCVALRITPITQLFFETDDEDIAIEQIYEMGGRMRNQSVEELKCAISDNYDKITTK